MDGDPVCGLANHVLCNACAAPNDASALFCGRCTAPLLVPSLGALDPGDLRLCRAALFEILGRLTKLYPAPLKSATHNENLWRRYLSAFWLRPETALILYAEAMAIRALTDRDRGPWLDLGCGDGIHAALTAGWEFDASFDAFASLDLQAKDIYHHWDPSQFQVSVIRAGRAIEHGMDIKPTAVSRASALGVFKNVHQADACNLPLPDRSIATIFSNMLRDLGEPLPQALAECKRVMTDDGVLILSAMTPRYTGSLYFVNEARKAEAAGDLDLARRLLRLDRGRSVFCQRQLTLPQWQSLLARAGLKLVDAAPIVSPAVIRFWDIGLRPFSPALLRQKQAWIDAGVLASIKPAAVNLIASQLEPLLDQLNSGPGHCMNLLVVSKV